MEAVSFGLKRQLLALKKFSISKPLGAAGLFIVVLVVIAAIFAPLVAPYDPYGSNLNEKGLPVRLEGPSATFLLGTDAIGRDVLSRVIYGAPHIIDGRLGRGGFGYCARHASWTGIRLLRRQSRPSATANRGYSDGDPGDCAGLGPS